MILSSSMHEKTYLQGFLEGALETIQVTSDKSEILNAMYRCIFVQT